MFTSNDVVMTISNSGNTDELLRFIPLLLERNIPIIGMSGNPESLLAQYSTCHLNIKVKHEADPLNLAPTSSTTATLAMGDALACALIEVRHFKATDFAQFHPGGSLGKRLLSRAKDYMVSTNLPIVTLDQKISETIIEISKTKQGIAVAIEKGTDFDGNQFNNVAMVYLESTIICYAMFVGVNFVQLYLKGCKYVSLIGRNTLLLMGYNYAINAFLRFIPGMSTSILMLPFSLSIGALFVICLESDKLKNTKKYFV